MFSLNRPRIFPQMGRQESAEIIAMALINSNGSFCFAGHLEIPEMIPEVRVP